MLLPRVSHLTTILCLVLAATLSAQEQTPAPVDIAKPAADTGRRVRRIPMTAELDRTAFKDARARTLLTRARVARMSQDSALQSYDATSYMRASVGLGIRRLGPERLLFRAEHAARVRWGRGSGVWVETTGRRAVVPMGGADMDLTPATPIPYFPGREQLWFPSEELRRVREEVNDRDLIHPLATGAEAYYKYETGDSVRIRLPDGRGINLRELRITARRPEWRAFVGSFWFDVESGSLVRAAYRMAAEVDIWREVSEETRKELEELERIAATDTGKLARQARAKLDSGDVDDVPRIVKGMFSPMRAKISAITVEYGLYEGRFWLPKRNVLEGNLVALFVRVPVRYEESYRYASVNGDVPVPKVPNVGEMGLTADDTTYFAEGNIVIGGGSGPKRDTSLAARTAREDSVLEYRRKRMDSLGTILDSLQRTDGDTARIRALRNRIANNRAIVRNILRRREECKTDSTYFAGLRSVYGTRMAVRLPCNTEKLATSPDLPPSIYGSDDQMFSSADRDQLLEGLDFSLQPGWGPQRPTLHTGLDLLRYNRIEGLSLGGSATSVLGMGYTAQAVVRLGTADLTPNGELSLSRSNGRSDIRLTGFHRLGVANDDWGSPLSFGASVANLLYARDEGFYYRSWGAELGGTRDAPGPMAGARMRWRIFGEQQYSADVEPNTQFSVSKYLGDARFRENIDAEQLVALGAGAELARSFGINPRGFRLDTRVRGEGALTDQEELFGTTGYARLMLDGTLSRPLGGFGFALTGAAGSSLGSLPIQRAFFIGGLQTVRGQSARLAGEGRVGDTFWLGRAEVARSGMVLRPALFYDVGWAGARESLSRMGRPLSGAGVGVSILDGFLRFDLSRGIYPEQRWRGDMYLGARF
ncbi:MAG TPA: hypothetical protein VEB19_02670 [Gemmatimonadaceae bacterium]|nr:hypothetical protein [Gemmatimonadaceae bacterium]